MKQLQEMGNKLLLATMQLNRCVAAFKPREDFIVQGETVSEFFSALSLVSKTFESFVNETESILKEVRQQLIKQTVREVLKDDLPDELLDMLLPVETDMEDDDGQT